MTGEKYDILPLKKNKPEKGTVFMSENIIDSKAMFKIGYGLYVLTTREDLKDNGCIINTAIQLTSNPLRVAVTVNKQNYSHWVLMRTGKCNVNCLTEATPFSEFTRFGFASGSDTNKFPQGVPMRSTNGIAVLPQYSNAFFSLAVEQYIDLDSHGMFICTVTEAKVLSGEETMTYSYYHKNVKPKPEKKADTPKGYVCKICGYVYEGDPLPEDFVCPLCKHGASDFEPLS